MRRIRIVQTHHGVKGSDIAVVHVVVATVTTRHTRSIASIASVHIRSNTRVLDESLQIWVLLLPFRRLGVCTHTAVHSSTSSCLRAPNVLPRVESVPEVGWHLPLPSIGNGWVFLFTNQRKTRIIIHVLQLMTMDSTCMEKQRLIRFKLYLSRLRLLGLLLEMHFALQTNKLARLDPDIALPRLLRGKRDW